MVLFGEVEIDVDLIRLPSWGRVVATPDAVVPFDVVGPDRQSVRPIGQFCVTSLPTVAGQEACAAMPMLCCAGGGGFA